MISATPKMPQLLSISLAVVLIPLLWSTAAEAGTDEWKFKANVYAWLPSVEGKTTFEGPDSPNGSVDIEKIVDSIESVFMGGVRFLDLEEELDWELSSQINRNLVNSRSGNVKFGIAYR